MSSASAVLGNEGSLHTIEHNGKVYKFGLVDQSLKTRLEKHLFNRSLEALILMKDALGADYQARLDNLGEQYTNGEFSFEAKTCLEYIKSRNGVLKLLEFMMGATSDEVVNLMIARGTEINTLLKLVLAESFPSTHPV